MTGIYMSLEMLYDIYYLDCREVPVHEAMRLLHTGERRVWMRSTPAAIVSLLSIVNGEVYEDYGTQYCIVRRYSCDDRFYSTRK